MLPYIGAPNIQVMGGTGTGVAVTAGSTAGAKTTTAVTLGTLNFETSEIVVSLISNAGPRRCRVDIFANTGGSDVIIAEDLYAETTSAATPVSRYNLPLRIPAGAVLKTKASSQTTGGASMNVHIAAYSAHPGSADVEFGMLKNLATLTNNDPPSVTLTGTTYTAWTDVTASTSIDVVDLFVQPAFVGDTTRTPAGSQLLQIAQGASGSEQVLGELQYHGQTGILETSPMRLKTGRIPAGTRLAFRVQHVGAAADLFGCNIWGLAA